MTKYWRGYFCCIPCRPKYRRMVDNIYPGRSVVGLNQMNLSKALFYFPTHPEKLGRVGEYLDDKVDQDLGNLRYDNVKISVNAMSSLLRTCHASPSLNLFVNSFVKVVERLLDVSNVELNLLAAKTFIEFAKIDEEAPNCNRPFTYLTECFSQMCHNNNKDLQVKKQLRVAGIQGMLSIIRKLSSDELQANLWQDDLLKLIIPALVFNVHDVFVSNDETDTANHCDEQTELITDCNTIDFTQGIPQRLSEDTLRELASQAKYTDIKFMMDLLLNHITSHNLWSTSFSVDIFKLLMCSINSQYSTTVIEQLIEYLSGEKDASIRQNQFNVRMGVVEVLNEIIVINVATVIGPSLLEVFNNLLRYLRVSVEYQCSLEKGVEAGELEYQGLLISTICKFVDYLQDFQKIEVMLFIASKVPSNVVHSNRPDMIFQEVLIRTLLKVATKYKTQGLANTLTSSFIEQLLRISLADNYEVRLNVQEILHTLLDRHNNLPALDNLHSVDQIRHLKLKIEHCSRADALFMRKNLPIITKALQQSALATNNHRHNYDAILKTIAILGLEGGHDGSMLELLRLVLSIQSAVLNVPIGNDNLSPSGKGQLHNMVAKLLSFLIQLGEIPSLAPHIEQVIKQRVEQVPFLDVLKANPPLADDDFVLGDDLLFDKAMIVRMLQSCGYDSTNLDRPMSLQICSTNDVLSVQNACDRMTMDRILTDLVVSSGSVVAPVASRRETMCMESEDALVTFEVLKQLVDEPASKIRDDEVQKSRKVVELFQNVPFETLVQEYGAKRINLTDSIAKALANSKKRSVKAKMTEGPRKKPQCAHEIQFPKLFVY